MSDAQKLMSLSQSQFTHKACQVHVTFCLGRAHRCQMLRFGDVCRMGAAIQAGRCNSLIHPLRPRAASISLMFCSNHSQSYRRKFRSQTSDNMDRWKSRGGKSQRGEEQKREDQRRERMRRKKMQVREKVGKSRNTVFFQWFVALEGRKVGSLKRRVQSHLARWEMNSCTPL